MNEKAVAQGVRLVQGLLVAIPSVSGGRVFVNTVLQTWAG